MDKVVGLELLAGVAGEMEERKSGTELIGLRHVLWSSQAFWV